MSVRSMCSGEVVTIQQSANLRTVAKLMEDRSVGWILVMDNSEAIGAITDRDIVIRACVQNLDLETTLVKDVMSAPLISTTPDCEVLDALEMIRKHGVRRIPVLDKDAMLWGVLSTDNVVQKAASELQKINEIYFSQVGTIVRHRCHDYTKMA